MSQVENIRRRGLSLENHFTYQN